MARARQLNPRREVRKVMMAQDTTNLLGIDPPEELLTPYPGVEGRLAGVQRKYMNRASNIGRCWNRAQLYTPELLGDGPRMKVLELSTAHGGMLEIYRHFGHDVLGNDYANFLHEGAEERPGHRTEIVTASTGDEAISQEITWPYRKIVESIDLPMTIFDAGKTPYPLEDKSVDYLMTFQAIEHYCHPLAWPALIDEFCRVARRAIIVMLNPLHGHLVNDEDYRTAFEDARKLLARYDRNGFRCTSVHIQWAQALGFKLTAAS